MSEIHDDLSAAFEELSNASDANDEITKSDAATDVDPKEPAPKGKEEQTRDEAGKFTPKVEAKDIKADDKGEKPPVEGEKQPSPKSATRAPVSWTPQEREHWDKTPPEVQATIIRREQQVTEALRVSAEAKQFQADFGKLIQPYMPMIQQEQSTPMGAVSKLLQTAAALRTAPAPQRAGLVADMIMFYGVDIEMLDDALSKAVKPGGRGDPAVNTILQKFDEKLQPVTNFMQKFEQNQRQTSFAPLYREIDDFVNDPKNEFAKDLLSDMSDFLMLAANRGQQMSLQEAYTRATMAHPEVSKILEARKLESKTAQQTAAARRAKDAAVSVSDNGAPSQNEGEPVGDDIRSALLASVKQHSRTR